MLTHERCHVRLFTAGLFGLSGSCHSHVEIDAGATERAVSGHDLRNLSRMIQILHGDVKDARGVARSRITR